jgi:hypothetical protein
MNGLDRHIRSIHIISILNLTFNPLFLTLTLIPPPPAPPPPAPLSPTPPTPHHTDPASGWFSQSDSLAYMHRKAYS